MVSRTVTTAYGQTGAVRYHYGAFPPANPDLGRLIQTLATTSELIGRYDQMLERKPNSALLLRPLERQEAVVSSRIEGTISTLDDVLQYEAEQDHIDEMREVSRTGDWTGWLVFFLEALGWQARTNLDIIDAILALYESMKIRLPLATGTREAIGVQDFIFSTPVFRVRQLARQLAMSPANAHRVVNALLEQGIVRVMSRRRRQAPHDLCL